MLDRLITEELDLMQKLAANRAEQKLLYTFEFEKEMNLKIGDRIKYINNGSLVECVIKGYEYDGNKPVRIIVYRVNNDGRVGKFKNIIYRHQFKTIDKIYV